MNKLILSMVAALALCVAASAQAGGPGSSPGTQNQQPGTQSPGTQNQQPGSQPGSYPQSGSQTGTSGNMGNESSKGEKKLKGCVQATGSQAMLETKKGKEVALTGQDLSAHNGHEVEVKGTWESGGSMSQSSAGAGSSGEKTFNVTDVKMISETCKSSKDKEKGSSSMGTGANGTNPSGTGSSSGSPTQPQ
jgi:hypothetical protein